MFFSSNILNEQNKSNNISSLSLRQMQEPSTESFIYDILESNDILHQIDTEENIGYYRYLSEYANGTCTEAVMTEGIVTGIHAFLSKAIQAIIDLIDKFINFLRTGAFKKTAADMRKLERDFHAATHGGINPKSNLAKVKKFKTFNRPAISDINDGYIAPSLNNVTSSIDRALSGATDNLSKDNIDKDKNTVYKILGKIAIKLRENPSYTNKITDTESFRSAVSADTMYTDNAEMSAFDYINKELERQRKAEDITKDAEDKMAAIRQILKNYDEKLKTRSGSISPEARDYAKELVQVIHNVVADVEWYFAKLISINTAAGNYANSVFRKATKSFFETSTIHGEMFDGNTLFDNEDYRDFNRTEWLDLELTAECYAFSAEARESRRRIAANEAAIFAEGFGYDTFKKLVAMREAEEKKLGDRFMEIIKNIMAAIDKFFANLRDKLSLDAAYIKKNLQYIQKPFNFQELKSTGDVINGLTRILDSSKPAIKPYDYASMQNDLEDEKAFFIKYIRPSLGAARSGSEGSDISPAEFCKAYYGASMPKDRYPEVVIGNKELEGARANIMTFLQAPNNQLAKIRDDVRKLEQEAKKASTKVGEKPSENPADKVKTGTDKKDDSANQSAQVQAPAANAEGEAKQESMYYSELYQRWFTEAEVNGGETAQETAKKSEKDGFKSYINAYKNVLLAKLTGAAFVRSELMQIITYHAQVNGAPKRVIKNKNEAPNGKATASKEQQQSQTGEGQPAN